MQFDEKTHKVKIETMNKDEAQAFVAFLSSEALRHQEDIDDIVRLIEEVEEMFRL